MTIALLLAEAEPTPYVTVGGFLIALLGIIVTFVLGIWKGFLPFMRKAQEQMAEMNKHCHVSLDDSTKRFTDALKERDAVMRETARELGSATAALTRLHDSLTRIEQKWT